MTRVDVTALSAVDLAAAIRDGQHSAEEAVEAYLARIEQVDSEIEAWAFLDPDHARAKPSKRTPSAGLAGPPARCMVCRWP